MYALKKYCSLSLVVSLLMTNCVLANADDDDKKTKKKTDEVEMLTIGSKAPAIDVEHWVQNGDGKFKEVTKFEDGKVYVVEFWATWCGPCIASMPHISGLQDEYADQGVQVVSISDEDLETVEKFLERDVRGKDDMTYADLTKNYCLTTDPDGSSQADYMEAAGQNGIPTSFIVGKDGHIEWIGHPMELDKPLGKIVEGNWDREKFATEFIASQKHDMMMGRIMKKLRGGNMDAGVEMIEDYLQDLEDGDLKNQVRILHLQALSRSDDTKKAIVAFDSYLKEMSDGDEKTFVKMMRFSVLVREGDQGIVTAFGELAEDYAKDPEGLNQISWSVVEMSDAGEEVSKELVSAAVDAASKAVEMDPKNGAVLDTLAHLVFMKGDLEKAIEIQKRAVEYAESPMKSDIEQYLKQLQKKQKQAKSDE